MNTAGLPRPIGVLFVCQGNICRSPCALGIFSALLQKEQLAHRIDADSCGTASAHLGRAPDARAIHAARRRGYDISAFRSRQIQARDYLQYSFIVAMDRMNLLTLQAWAPKDFQGQLGLLMQYSAGSQDSPQIVDPYQESAAAFEAMVNRLELGVAGLLHHLCQLYALPRSGGATP